MAKARVFQSTHPHGVRRVGVSAYIGIAGFNPRTRTGCDDMGTRVTLIARVFQSTHPHGVRHHNPNVIVGRVEFQSTHPHGVRPKSLITPHA